MGCVLWVRSENFDVDGFMSTVQLPYARVFRRGEPRTARPEEVLDCSGFTLKIMVGSFDDLDAQIRAAIAALEANEEKFERLNRRTDVTSKGLDFGIRWKSTYTQTDRLPAELVRLAGRFGLELAVSHYPISDAHPHRVRSQ